MKNNLFEVDEDYSREQCYIIAEAGVNHNGSLNLAKELIHAAKASNADAVKFQAFIPELLASSSIRKASYQTRNYGEGSQLEMLKNLALPLNSFSELKNTCDELSIDFICTAFDTESLQAIMELNPICLKWPSGEITNIPLIREAARYQKPVIISTGMSSLGEVERAIQEFESEKCQDIALLQCVSNYPAPQHEQNLRSLNTLRNAFNKRVGFSDHTTDVDSALIALGLGMKIWEKHITLDRQMSGPDHRASVEPDTFADYVSRIRAGEIALGDGSKKKTKSEEDTARIARKRLFYKRGIRAGNRLTESDLLSLRSEIGIAAENYDLVIGKKVRYDTAARYPCLWDELHD